jgi:hypothetical protein
VGDLTREQLGELDYTIEKVHFIRTAIAGYVGGAAIASELAQNADDAPAQWLRFHFTPQALLVHNSGVFTEKDFKNITHIASGGKRDDEQTIGTWGTGFLSVYQITDHPELESAGRYVRFDPTQDKIPYFSSAVDDATLFRFPWRREQTDLATELEAESWPEERIKTFKEELAVEVYRQIIFLRNVETIEVCDGTDKPKILYRVHKARKEDTKWTPDFTREIREITYYRSGQKEIKDAWVYYSTHVPENLAPDGYKVKDREVAIAFPLSKRGRLKENIPGYLYNFLPTQIRTGFAFQINGAFAPKSDRTSVLVDTSIKADWNRTLINRLAQLFTDALDDIRDLVEDDPKFFYELLPLQHNQDYPFLAPIRERFVKIAPDKRLVYSSLREWVTPDKVKVGGPASLQKLVENHIPLLPAGATQAFRNFLSNDLDRPPLRLTDVLTHLSSQLEPNTPLEQAPIINDYSKLTVVYKIAQQEWSRLQNQLHETYAVTMLRRQLESAPLCLDEGGVLKQFSDSIWRGEKIVRDLVPNIDVCFVDAQLQANFTELLADFLDEFGPREFLKYLHNKLAHSRRQTLTGAPEIINSQEKLQTILHFLYQDLSELPEAQLADTPLILDDQGILRTAGDKIRFHDDAYECNLIRPLEIAFVSPDLAQDEKVLAVYRKAGVLKLTPRDVIEQLERLCPQPILLKQAHPAIASVEKLRDLYKYFDRYSHNLAPNDKHSLRQLPIYLTQEGCLAAIDDPHTPLKLSVRAGAAWQSNLDVLELDNLIHSDILTGNIRHFLNKELGVEELSPFIIIRDYLLRHYNALHLNHTQRLDLLDFARITWDKLGEAQREALRPALAETQLVRCQDGEYRCGSEVYFASPALDTVFVSGYCHPHPNYGIPTAQPKDDDQRPYVQKKWYRLFHQLGLKEYPAPADLIDAVERVVTAGPPTEERVDAVRRIYTLLQAEVGRLYQTDDSVLCRLRAIAWLPASNDSNWHKPSQIYPPRFTQLIGNQAPILQFSEQQNTNQLLELPTTIPILLVIEHLRDTARKNERVHLSIYEYLGTHLDELPEHLVNTLRKEAVVWDGNDGFRLPNRVFFDNHQHLFGKRRWYLSPPNVDARRFMERIGVRTDHHQWQDSIALIQEIAADYANGKIIKGEDRELLLRNFDHLGQQLQNGNSDLLIKLQSLQQSAIIPGRDKQLHPSHRIVLADQPEILEQFDDDAFPVVHEEGFTADSIYRFLHQVGVPQLSKIVERRAVSTKGSREDTAFNLRVERLAYAFDRIELTVREDKGDYSQDNLPSEQLRKVRFFVVPRLQVAYNLNLAGENIMGYKREELTLYDVDSGYFYVKQERSGQISKKSHLPLAKEFERIFFPDNRKLIAIVIEQLLDIPLSEIDNYLTDRNFRNIRAKHIEYENNAEDESPPTWQEDGPALWKQQDTDQDEVSVQPPLFTLTQMPLPTPAQTPPAADKPEAEAEPAAPPQPEQPQSDAGQPEPESMTPTVTDGDKPLPPDVATTSSEKTMQSADDPAKEAGIPRFTGQRWPISIRQPNDYARLSQEFGLPLDTNEGNRPTQASDDTEWEPAQPQGKEKETTTDRPIILVRFTLNYQNRYEGFLPLHSRARQMLVDQPKILTCLTDYPDEWSFKLYVEYNNAGMIYNEDRLPQFFEAFNIPAGGIVYLERLEAHHTVRLFWNNAEQTIRNVKRHELMENGEIDEFRADMEVPCEINEHILRAETRLEDIEAFIRKSVGQPGVFTLICDAFGEDKAELSYNEIFERVQSKRPVADFTIRAELYARPCFVPLGDNRWRFESSRGDRPIVPDRKIAGHQPKTKSPTRAQKPLDSRQPEQPSNSYTPESTSQQPANSPEPSPPRPPSPYQIVLNEAQQEWQTLSDFFNLDGHDPAARLQELAEYLSKLAQRLQRSLTTLAQPVPETDDLLAATWQDLDKNPGDTETRRRLQQYLREKFTQEENELLFVQVNQLLERTAPQHRDLVFFPLLGDIASQLTDEGEVAPSRSLYELLQDRGAGDFQAQLQRLDQFGHVQAYLDLAQSAETTQERWQVWSEAWQEYPGYPTLRRAIQADVKSRVTAAEQEVDSSLSQKNVQNAFENYLSLLADITPFVDAWQTDQTLAPRIWGLAQRLFEVLRDAESYRQALELVAKLPGEAQLRLDGNIYLEAIQEIAEEFENRADNLAAAALMDYGIIFANEKGWPVDDYVLVGAYENVSRLYENLAMPHRAYHCITRAKLKSIGDKKTQLGHRAYALNQKRDEAQKQVELQSLQVQTEALLNKSDFSQLVNPEVFQLFCNQK